MTHLMIPYLTTARTTAFMPALSPPDVRTAILRLAFDMIETWDVGERVEGGRDMTEAKDTEVRYLREKS